MKTLFLGVWGGASDSAILTDSHTPTFSSKL